MSDLVIKVEGLGKCYRIHHEQPVRYKTLRDTIAGGFSRFAKLKPQGSKPKSSDEDFWALKDVSFEINQGDVVGIIGRNGAGKSTLLKILSRITEPTEGRITLRGRVSSLLEVGTGFHPELTGRENVFLNGTILGMRRAEIRSKFDEIVAFAEVEKFLDTPVKHYSSGMHMRLAFGVAAFLEPEILIVDEVLAVGDAEFQKKCLGKMNDVARGGRTVLLVSHNMSAVNQLCTRGLVLSQGRVAFCGSTGESIATYRNLQESHGLTILEHLEFSDAVLSLTHAALNGSPESLFHVDADNSPLRLDFEFNVAKPAKIALHAFLSDVQGTRLGICSPGHMKEDNTFAVTPGVYRLSCTLQLPLLTKGRYFLDIGFSEPGVKIFANLPMAVELDVAGRPAISGAVFEQNSVNGFLVLDGSVRVQSVAKNG